jgi:thiosulfate dehydrogenase (quinone) large subunit
MDRLQQLSNEIQARLRTIIVPFIRVVVGLLWLENASWKVPTSFSGSFRRYTESAVSHEVFGPYAFFAKNIALKNFTAFGWMTLLSESLIGALLIFGIFTRGAALMGAVASLFIAFSVLHVANEWPWSYYLMIVAHLALFALDAGRIGGIDAVLARRGNADGFWKRPALTVGVSASILGALSFWRAGSLPFGAKFGQYLLAKRSSPAGYELALHVLNRRGALILLLLGLVIIAASLTGQRKLLLVATAGFGILYLTLIVGFRRTAAGTVGGFVGGNGSTMSLFIGFTLATFLLAGGTNMLRRRSR